MSDAHGPAPERPTFPRARAFVAGLLFVCWIGYLASLVAVTRDTIPLAEPQLRTADLVIVADIADDEGRPTQSVRVKEVLSTAKAVEFGANLIIDDLPFAGPRQGYRGAGAYVIPLERRKDDLGYRVNMLPIVPGYFPQTTECEVYYKDDKGAVSKVLSDVTGVPENRIEAMFTGPSIVVPNLPFFFASDDAKKFEARIRKAGGLVEIPAREGETRIYPATTRVIEDVRRLLSKRGERGQ